MTLAEELATFVVRASYGDLSEAARRQLTMRVLDSLGCAIGALQAEPVTLVRAQYEVYKGVIPPERHKAITKHARKTNHIERFNNPLRQRISRLTRETLSFSKKLAHHIGAIKYFICHDNLTKAPALLM
jgi:IS1 family transposase